MPALAINWGVLGGEGYVARNERVAEFLARQGTGALTPAEVTSLMESFLTAHATQVAAIRVDWAKWRQSFRGMQDNPLVERIFAGGVETAETGGGGTDWRAKIQAASAEDRNGVIGEIKTITTSFGDPAPVYNLKEEPAEPGLDWDRWCGPGPLKPYSSVLSPRGVHNHFPAWRMTRAFRFPIPDS